MLAVPTVEGVKCTAHVAVPVNPAVSVQVVWSKAPETPANEKATAPNGVRDVPPVEVSVTVAMHVEDVVTMTGVSQLIDVDVERRLTVIVNGELVELAR